MRKIGLLRTVLTENGFAWVVNRSFYQIKLKMIRIPIIEKIFESPQKKTKVKRCDIFTIESDSLCKFLRELPKNKKAELISVADNATKGIIKGFSSLELDYGYPINWQLNPETGISCDKMKKWFFIPDFDNERGDVKLIWEASRLTHFQLFARAFLLTGEKKYYIAFSKQLSHWLKENKYSYGCNYKCGQECALRMMSVLIAYAVFKSAGLITAYDEENVRLLVYDSYRKILSNFFYAYRCVKNNHTISELVGMIIGAWCCEDKKVLSKAYKILDKVVAGQFTSDGGYKQYSFNYQRFVMQILVYLQSISSKTQMSLSHYSKEIILKSVELMYQVIDLKSGDVPNYGSNDGALPFPLSACDYRDFRPVINTVFSVYGEKRVFDFGIWDEERIWFNGANELPLKESYEQKSMSFPEAGIFMLRCNRGFVMLVLNDYKSRPAHMDQLHMDVWIDGINVFCDTGTYSYTENQCSAFVLTEGHNTVKVNDKQQMNQQGQFLITNWTERIAITVKENMLEGEYQSRAGYTHKRKVVLSEDEIEIIDTVTGYRGPWTIRFHTPCDTIGRGSQVSLISDGRLICSLECNNFRIDPAERSLYYQNKEIIKCITIFQNEEDTTMQKTRIRFIGETKDD